MISWSYIDLSSRVWHMQPDAVDNRANRSRTCLGESVAGRSYTD
jgi:hypothetical protein